MSSGQLVRLPVACEGCWLGGGNSNEGERRGRISGCIATG
jgi:hypothetical protein